MTNGSLHASTLAGAFAVDRLYCLRVPSTGPISRILATITDHSRSQHSAVLTWPVQVASLVVGS